MLMQEILPDQRRIVNQLRVTNKKNLIEEIADRASEISKVSSASIAESLFIREKLGSTGLGMGVAIPHARFPGINQIMGFFFRLENSIDFESHDHQPVDLIFLLLVPEDAGTQHLKVLAKLSRLLKTPGFLEKLRHTYDKEDIYALLVNEDIRKVA